MPTQRIFDASGGVVSTVTYDDLTKKVTYAQYQDPNPVLRHAARQRELPAYICGGDMRRVASIPNVVLLKWLREAKIPVRSFMQNSRLYSKWLERKIYDSENSAFLTATHKRSIASPNLIIPS
jgi:hypothetical protein